MRIRSDMSGMRVLSGLRAPVETFPMWWAFPTSEYYARYDSPTAYGGLSLSQDSSTCLARVLPQCVGSSIVPCPGCPLPCLRSCRPYTVVFHGRNVWGLPSASTSLFLHATA